MKNEAKHIEKQLRRLAMSPEEKKERRQFLREQMGLFTRKPVSREAHNS